MKECLEHDLVDDEIKDRFDVIFKGLMQEKIDVVPVNFELLDYLVPSYYVLTTAEASSNLARYDGIHYGYKSETAIDLESTYVKTRTEGFGKEVKRRIMLGTFVLSAGYYDAYFGKAQKVRRLIKDCTDSILKDHDFILLPTTTTLIDYSV